VDEPPSFLVEVRACNGRMAGNLAFKRFETSGLSGGLQRISTAPRTKLVKPRPVGAPLARSNSLAFGQCFDPGVPPASLRARASGPALQLAAISRPRTGASQVGIMWA